MYRLIEEIVRSGLVTAWRFASCPTSRSPVFVNATTEGVVRDPSELAMTVGLCPSITATTEFVVPRSMPTTFAMLFSCLFPSRVDQLSESGVPNSSGLASYHSSRDVSAAALDDVSPMIRRPGTGVPPIPCDRFPGTLVAAKVSKQGAVADALLACLWLGRSPAGLGVLLLLLLHVLLDRLLGQGRLDVLLDALGPDAQGDLGPRLEARDRGDQVVGRVDRLAVDGLDDVAGFDPGDVGRRAADDLRHRDAALVRIAAELRADVAGDRGGPDTQEALPGPGAVRIERLARVLDQNRRRLDRRIGRDREADALRRAGVRGRLVHADHPAVVIDQRAARVTGVDRRRGLEQPLEEMLRPVVAGDRLVAVEARDDADGHRVLQLERLADGDRPLPGRDPGAAGELDRRRQLGVVVDLYQGQVGRRIRRVHVRFDLVAVTEDDDDRADALGHDVGIGQDQAVARVDETGPRSALADAALDDRTLLSEHLRERVDRDELGAVDDDLEGDDRRLDPLDGVDDAALVVGGAGHREGCCVDGGGRVPGPGDSREVGTREEHHREAPDDRADQP